MGAFSISIVINLVSVWFAVAAGCIRLQPAVKNGYLPFLLFIWVGAGNDTLSWLLIRNSSGNAVNSNIYVWVEYMILLYQFYKWRGCNRQVFIGLILLGTGAWMVDNLLLNTLTDNNSLFRGYTSLIISLLAIDRMAKLIACKPYGLAQQSLFLISSAFLLYYGCKIFMEIINIFRLPFSSLFYQYLWLTLSIINCISNIIYTIAIVCIPKRQEFILPY